MLVPNPVLPDVQFELCLKNYKPTLIYFLPTADYYLDNQDKNLF